MNDIEGKAARGAVSECGQGANFNPFNQNFDLRTGAFTQCPVDGDALANLGDEFGGTDLEVVFAHDFQGAVVLG